MNQVVEDFSNVDVSDLKLPLISVYYNPADIPDKYVARLFDTDKPTYVVAIKDTLEEIRSIIPSGLTRIERKPADHPTVVEVWV